MGAFTPAIVQTIAITMQSIIMRTVHAWKIAGVKAPYGWRGWDEGKSVDKNFQILEAARIWLMDICEKIESK